MERQSDDLGAETLSASTQEEPSTATPANSRACAPAFEFDAFLSYSHGAQADRGGFGVADRMERDLENFPLSRSVRREYLNGRNLNVFRDESDLVGGALEASLQAHLAESKTLVVLCSPAARGSIHVDKEIRWFAAHRDCEKIFPVLVSGSPNHDPNADSDTWAFPDALDDVLGGMPFVPDMRQSMGKLELAGMSVLSRLLRVDGGKLASRAERLLQALGRGRRDKLGRGSPWIKLVSNVMGVRTDVLTKRVEKAEFWRRIRIIVAILAVFGVIATLGTMFYLQRNDARRELHRAAALSLISQGQAMLDGQQASSDVAALQEILSAPKVSEDADRGALFTGVIAKRDTVKIIQTPTAVTAVAITGDGRHAAYGGDDGVIRLFDAASGAEVGSPLRGHAAKVTSVAFSPDGKRIVSGSDDKTLRLWDAATATEIGLPLKGHAAKVTSVAFSPDGKRIVSGSDDKTLRLWDASGAEIGLPLVGHEGPVTSVAFSPDGRQIASGSADRTLRLWDATTESEIGSPMRGHTDLVRSVAFSPDGRRIVSGGHDFDLRLWDAVSQTSIGEPLKGHTNWVLSVAFSRGGERVVSSSDDDTVRLWDVVVCHELGPSLT